MSRCLQVTATEWLPLTIVRGPYVGGLSIEIVKSIAKVGGMCGKISCSTFLGLYTIEEFTIEDFYCNNNMWFSQNINLKNSQFTVEYIHPADGFHGFEQPNGTWTGMIGQILSGKAEMSGTLFFVTEERSAVVEFSAPLFIQSHKIIYKTPQLQPNIAGFLLPFTPIVWTSITAMLVAMILIMSVLFFIYNTIYEDWGTSQKLKKEITKEAKEEPWWRSFQFTVGTLFGQSCPWSPNSDLIILMMFGLWLWVSFIVGTIYKSNLKSMIILPKIKIPFDTLEELVDQHEYDIIMPGGGFLHQKALYADPDSTLGQLNERAIITTDFNAAYARVSQGEAAAMGNEINLFIVLHVGYTQKARCEYTITKTGFMSNMQMAFAFKKGSVFLPAFNKVITRLNEGGLLTYMLDRSVSNATLCRKNKKMEVQLRPLSFWDFAGMFSLYLGGVSISICVFVAEILKERRARKIKDTTLMRVLSGKPEPDYKIPEQLRDETN